ncbi:hypothetical protein PV11_02136 [Exophiala sideris]|uniref:Uncharacterized protein n=1 Tax=Exophiala sideris TaxID=1016849 RepID=A0A0D1YYG4_9EURO|nr:hypothetical protein PV11_02136 [Exophiala sideris]
MSSRLLGVTIQGAVLSAASNTLAQGFRVYREGDLSAIDPVAFIQFILFAIISTPPNYKWQLWLEETFPSNPKQDVGVAKKKDDTEKDAGKETFSIANTIAKFLLDQTIGAVGNTLLFIVVLNLMRGAGWSGIVTAVQKDFYPMLLAGYKFWPLVTLVNLVLVPVEQRMLIGGLAGLAWGVYVSLMNI